MHGLNIKSHVPQNKKEMTEWINKSIKQIKSLHQLFILENKLKKKQTIALYKTNLNFTIEQNDE